MKAYCMDGRIIDVIVADEYVKQVIEEAAYMADAGAYTLTLSPSKEADIRTGIIVYMADIDYTLPDYPHTGLFYWIVSWNDWEKSSTPKRNQAYTPAEAIKIIKQAMQELGISKNTIQETLFF